MECTPSSRATTSATSAAMTSAAGPISCDEPGALTGEAGPHVGTLAGEGGRHHRAGDDRLQRHRQRLDLAALVHLGPTAPAACGPACR